MGITEKHAMEELLNIVRNEPLWPGDTVAHRTANECVRRGWAKRNEVGDFIPTAEGSEIARSRGWVP